MRHRKLAMLIAGVGVVSLLAAACDDGSSDSSGDEPTTEETDAPDDTSDDTASDGDTASGTIVDVASGNDDFSTLVAAVQAAGLVETLSGEGPFTVFAPTDDAFAQIPQATLDAILADKELLTQILTYHVVAGKVTSEDVAGLPDVASGAAVATVEGQDATIVADGSTLKINDANITATDIEASNGVIHVIDAVLLPPGVQLPA